VVLTPGFKTVDGNVRPELGYGQYPNVVTSLEFERILSASGPFAGTVQRISDGKHPKKVAFIQCVGSRDTSCGNDYCSSVCCMYATKEAVIAREHDNNIEPTIFYMDIRAYGKGFDRFIDKAKDQHKTKFINGRIASVESDPVKNDLRVQYITQDGSIRSELFDLLVLSVGGDITRSEDPNKRGYSHGSVTLSATVEQAQLLTQAQTRGRLSLTLRNAEDIQLVQGVPETTSKDLLPAKDRVDWRSAKASAPKEIEHVR